MFFGVVLQPGKAYSQTLEYDLLLSQVALGESSKKTDKTTLLIEVEGHKFVLATLRAGIVEQAQLNVQLIAGTSIKLLNPAGADLHVIGNYIIQEEDDFYDYDEFDSEDSEFSEDSEGSDDDDEDEEGQSSSDDDQDVFSREKTNKRSLDRDSDASQDSKKARTVSDSFKTNEKPLTKLPPKPVAENKTPSKPAAVENKTPSKADNKTPSKPAAAENKTPSKADNKTPSKAESKTPSKADNKTPSKADNKTPSKPESKTPSKPENETPSKPSSSDNKTPSKAASSSDSKPASSSDRIRHPSGLAYTVLKSAPAAAPTAKKGRTVVVAYKGTLQQGGKQFDAQKKFDFKLGVGDVIKGWDIGVEGMKVGEKRKLFVPPSLAYGKDGVNENGKWVIPRNAALDFEVELLQIKD